MTDSTLATLHVAPTKGDIPNILNNAILNISKQAIKERNVFTIALSGGSLPSFLSELPTLLATTEHSDVDTTTFFTKWHVILADERCVSITHDDSNMKSLYDKLFNKLPETMKIPTTQIYPINESMLESKSTSDIAVDYESNVVTKVLDMSGGILDVAVLGFGPDGHTCSLFPNHELLKETTKLVAPITDSPKPPPNRITLTFKVLNEMTRNVIFCGAGSSKQPIIQEVFNWNTKDDSDEKKTSDSNEGGTCSVMTLTNPAPYPCGMVRPKGSGSDAGSNTTLAWVIDSDALPATAKL